MKQLRLLAYAFALALTLSACEKPLLDEDEKKEPTTEKGDQGNTGSGNTGTSTGDKGSNDDSGGSESSGGGSGTAGGQGGGTAGDGLSEGTGKQNSPFNVYSFYAVDYGSVVWVHGYIVGAATGANGKNRYVFEEPYTYKTAILLADSPTETDLSKVISIQLSSGSKLRSIANLADNPENKGRKILIYGEKTTYLKLPGIKGVQAYDTIGW